MKEKKDNLEKVFFIFSFALLITIPLGYFLSSLSFGLWFFYSCYWVFKVKHYKVNFKLLPFLLFTFLIIISFLWTHNEQANLNKVLRQLPLFLTALIGLFIPKISLQKFKIYIHYYATYLAVFSLILFSIAFYKFYKFQFEGFLFYHSLGVPFDLNAIYLSYMISVALLFKISNFTNSILNYSVITILSLFLILLSSKNVLFITFFILLYVLFLKIESKYLKWLTLVFFTITISTSFIFFKPLKNRFITEFDTSFNEVLFKETLNKGRVYTGLEARLLQIRAYSEIMETPITYVFGLGLSGSEEKLANTHKKLNTPKVFQKYNFHNQYLQVLSEQGIVGLILLIVSLSYGLKESYNKNFLLPFLIISMVLFISESILWRQRGLLFFGFLYISLFLINSDNEGKKQVSKI